MSGINPQGCQVFSFKPPSAEELEHDSLWNATRRLPERGRIGIFNRSYYEEVLIVRVHPKILSGEGTRNPIRSDGGSCRQSVKYSLSKKTARRTKEVKLESTCTPRLVV